jgi:hypothetical protein
MIPRSISVDTAFPQAAHAATKVLFSFAFSLGIPAERLARLIGRSFHCNRHVCRNTCGELNPNAVFAEAFDWVLEPNASPVDAEPGFRKGALDVKVRNRAKQLSLFAGTGCNREDGASQTGA